MTVSASVSSAIAVLQGSLATVVPLETATDVQLLDLQKQASDLIVSMETELAAKGIVLDSGDPTGFTGAFPDYLSSLVELAADESRLSESRGLVGRALFSLKQVRP